MKYERIENEVQAVQMPFDCEIDGQFVMATCWVVNDGASLSVLADADFRKLYRLKPENVNVMSEIKQQSSDAFQDALEVARQQRRKQLESQRDELARRFGLATQPISSNPSSGSLTHIGTHGGWSEIRVKP